MRQLPREGEKRAVGYWQSHDPDYLALFQKFLATTDRQQRFALYVELAQRTLEPVGGLIGTPVTLVTLRDDDWTGGDLEKAFDLLGELGLS